MVSEELVKRLLNKLVHVDFFNEKTGQIEWVEGNFESCEVIDDDARKDPEQFIEIESETDLDRINVKDVKKIYLKE